MRRLFRLLLSGSIAMGFAQCGSSQVFTETPPFKLGDVVQEPWTAGEDRSESGTNILIPVTGGEEVILDSLHFHGQKVALQKIQKGGYLVYIGRVHDPVKPDMIMHADGKQEAGNQPPLPLMNSPFTLDENEAVVSYRFEGVQQYYKLEDIPFSTPIHYKEKPPF